MIKVRMIYPIGSKYPLPQLAKNATGVLINIVRTEVPVKMKKAWRDGSLKNGELFSSALP